MSEAIPRGIENPSAPAARSFNSMRKKENLLSIAPPRIDALPAGTDRPFWSVMIPVYNCREDYLRETLESVLQQDPGLSDMQIEVIDNCSTIGNLEHLVHELGGGRIAFYRQPANLGIVENFNTCIRRARGHWVHILHADDSVRPTFYHRLRWGLEAHPEAGAVLCRTIFMDDGSQWTGLAELETRVPGILDADFATRQLLEQRIQFVAIAVRRDTYEELGGFNAALSHCIDWDMWKRVALAKAIYYEPEPLACCRMHAAAESSHLMRTGANVVDERRSIEFSCASLPRNISGSVRRLAKKAAGVRAERRARQLWKTGHRAAAWRQFREGIRCSLAPAVLARSFYFLLRTVVH